MTSPFKRNKTEISFETKNTKNQEKSPTRGETALSNDSKEEQKQNSEASLDLGLQISARANDTEQKWKDHPIPKEY